MPKPTDGASGRSGVQLIMSQKQVDRMVAPACRGGKSELRRAVCRITSGIPASKLEDGQCHRKHTAPRKRW